MAITPNEKDIQKFNKMLQDMGAKQVLPNGNRMNIKTISTYLSNMDIRKVRIIVEEALDNNELKYEYPMRVNSANKDNSILLKIVVPRKKNILPYRHTIIK